MRRHNRIVPRKSTNLHPRSSTLMPLTRSFRWPDHPRSISPRSRSRVDRTAMKSVLGTASRADSMRQPQSEAAWVSVRGNGLRPPELSREPWLAFGASHWRTGGVRVDPSLVARLGRGRRAGGMRVWLPSHIAVPAISRSHCSRADRGTDRARLPGAGEHHDHDLVTAAGSYICGGVAIWRRCHCERLGDTELLH